MRLFFLLLCSTPAVTHAAERPGGTFDATFAAAARAFDRGDAPTSRRLFWQLATDVELGATPRRRAVDALRKRFSDAIVAPETAEPAALDVDPWIAPPGMVARRGSTVVGVITTGRAWAEPRLAAFDRRRGDKLISAATATDLLGEPARFCCAPVVAAGRFWILLEQTGRLDAARSLVLCDFEPRDTTTAHEIPVPCEATGDGGGPELRSAFGYLWLLPVERREPDRLRVTRVDAVDRTVARLTVGERPAPVDASLERFHPVVEFRVGEDSLRFDAVTGETVASETAH